MKPKIHPYFKQKLTISTNGSTYSYDFPSLPKTICKSLLRFRPLGNNPYVFHQPKVENLSTQKQENLDKDIQRGRLLATETEVVAQVRNVLLNFFALQQEKNLSYTIVENAYYSNAFISTNTLGLFKDSFPRSPKQHFVRLSLETAATATRSFATTFLRTETNSDDLGPVTKTKPGTSLAPKKPSMFSICDTDTFSHPF